jgi:hypothetical protein
MRHSHHHPHGRRFAHRSHSHDDQPLEYRRHDRGGRSGLGRFFAHGDLRLVILHLIVFRRGTVTPDRLPKVTPSDRPLCPSYQRNKSCGEGSQFKADRLSERPRETLIVSMRWPESGGVPFGRRFTRMGFSESPGTAAARLLHLFRRHAHNVIQAATLAAAAVAGFRIDVLLSPGGGGTSRRRPLGGASTRCHPAGAEA